MAITVDVKALVEMEVAMEAVKRVGGVAGVAAEAVRVAVEEVLVARRQEF